MNTPRLDTATRLHAYTHGVIAPARAYSRDVRPITVALRGYVATYGDDIYQDAITETGRSTLFTSKLSKKGNKLRHYCLVVESNPARIDLRRGSAAGRIIATFNNQSTADEIDAVFAFL